MSESKRKRDRIILSASSCYFCGAASPTTVDHFPPRICFVRRIGPEGFEFPCCTVCNQMMRFVEQAVGCYIHLLDQSDERLIEAETIKHYSGIRNNFPELMPILNLTSNEKRRAFKVHHSMFRVAETLDFPRFCGRLRASGFQ